MTKKVPSKAHREGITLMELAEMFPDEATAVSWFEAQVWEQGRHCPRCGNTETREVPNAKPMPYWCGACRSYFSVKTGTALEHSRIPMRKWAFTIYLCATFLKSVSSMKLHRDIGVTQKTAWFMLHRLREAWAGEIERFNGPVEIDETHFGGKRKNMPKSKRKKLTRRGMTDKIAVASVKDRSTNRIQAGVVQNTRAMTPHGSIRRCVEDGALLYTDDYMAYSRIPSYRHDAVRHSVGEYVKGMAHTQTGWSRSGLC